MISPFISVLVATVPQDGLGQLPLLPYLQKRLCVHALYLASATTLPYPVSALCTPTKGCPKLTGFWDALDKRYRLITQSQLAISFDFMCGEITSHVTTNPTAGGLWRLLTRLGLPAHKYLVVKDAKSFSKISEVSWRAQFVHCTKTA
jgi:hypothetical protein